MTRKGMRFYRSLHSLQNDRGDRSGGSKPPPYGAEGAGCVDNARFLAGSEGQEAAYFFSLARENWFAYVKIIYFFG